VCHVRDLILLFKFHEVGGRHQGKARRFLFDVVWNEGLGILAVREIHASLAAQKYICIRRFGKGRFVGICIWRKGRTLHSPNDLT
jgi:hypothetical protein